MRTGFFFSTTGNYFDLFGEQMPDDKLDLFVHSECFKIKVIINSTGTLHIDSETPLVPEKKHPTSHF